MFQGASVFITHKGKLLLILRDDIPTILQPNLWELPGGRADAGETPKQTALREAYEETNINLNKVKFLFKSNESVYLFHANISDQQAAQLKLGNEGQQVRFYRLEEIKDLPITWQLKSYLTAKQNMIKSLITGT